MPDLLASEGFWIDGQIRPPEGDDRQELFDPGTEAIFASVPIAIERDVDAAVGAARAAFTGGPWPSTTRAERIRILVDALDRVMTSQDEIADVLASEIGSPVRIGRMSVAGAVSVARGLCAQVTELPDVEEFSGPWDYLLQRCPRGVVANVSPWNGPFFTTLVKSATALLAGCCVVDKPPAEAPFDGLFWGRALQEAGLPRGAFNVIPAGPSASGYLVAHRGVDKVSFTGGTETGRRIAAVCGEQLKPVVLELGGKSAAVVLDDAELDVVATGIASGTFFNAGQVCSALTRVIVPRGMEDAVAAVLAKAAGAVVLGDPRDDDAMMGPLFSSAHRDRVDGFVQRALDQGARLVTGGRRPADRPSGWYYEPTVLRGVDNSSEIAREEVFGPVAAIIPCDDDTQAIAFANDSPYGLHAAVFSADIDRARRVAAQLQTGSVTINGYTSNFAAPREGWKGSGLGVQNGIEGYNTHLVNRVINLRPGKAAWNPGAVLT